MRLQGGVYAASKQPHHASYSVSSKGSTPGIENMGDSHHSSQSCLYLYVPAEHEASRLLQAVGAGRMDTLPQVFQRCLLFLSLHGIPACALLACMPRLYRAMGQSPEVGQFVSHQP